MNDLEKSLGKALTAKQLAEYLGVNETSIRKNFQRYGGIKVNRQYRFFTKGVIRALQEQAEEQVHRTSQDERSADRESVRNKETSLGLGGRDQEKIRSELERDDKHNIFG